MTKPAPALRALLEGLIDYAGIFPPASLSLDDAVTNYKHYATGNYAWMLHWFVVNGSDVQKLPDTLNGALAVLGEADVDRAASLETKTVVEANRPVYCEVGLGKTEQLDAVKSSGCFAKIRTGGVKPEAIPSPADVAAFISACAERKLGFKATAGLHHPIRAQYKLTYDDNAPTGTMHGFLNVLMASAFAWNGEQNIEPILAETDMSSFKFDDRAYWRGQSLSIEQIKDTRRNFMHSIGSCSFDEPVNELQALGLL